MTSKYCLGKEVDFEYHRIDKISNFAVVLIIVYCETHFKN